MKKLLSLIMCLCSIQPVYSTNLHIKVAGTAKQNTYFLCVNRGGCMSMYAAAHGKLFPIDSGKVNRIFMVNARNSRLYPQALPTSCAIDVAENQTLTVSGKIVQHGKGAAQIDKLNCHVS